MSIVSWYPMPRLGNYRLGCDSCPCAKATANEHGKHMFELVVRRPIIQHDNHFNIISFNVGKLRSPSQVPSQPPKRMISTKIALSTSGCAHYLISRSSQRLSKSIMALHHCFIFRAVLPATAQTFFGVLCFPGVLWGKILVIITVCT